MQVNHNRFLGYTKDEHNKLVINPEQAKIVKRIYREYLEGASLVQIARGLEADEILTAVNGLSGDRSRLKRYCKTKNISGTHYFKKHIP